MQGNHPSAVASAGVTAFSSSALSGSAEREQLSVHKPLVVGADVIAGIALVSALTIILIVGGVSDTPAEISLLLMPIFILTLGRRLFSSVLYSPVWISVVAVSAVGISGALFQERMNGSSGGGASLDIPSEIIHRTAVLFGEFALWLTIGAVAAAGIRQLAGFVPTANTPQPRSTKIVRDIVLQYRGLILVGSFLLLSFDVVMIRGQLFHRPQHLIAIAGTSLIAVALQASVGCVAILAFVSYKAPMTTRVLASLLIAGFALLSFALSSRSLALIPLMIAVATVVAGARHRLSLIVIGSIVSFLVLPIPLYLRTLDSHGLFPYLGAMQNFSYVSVNWTETLTNVLIAFPITGIAAFSVPALPHEYLAISLNPLPGSLTGFYSITDNLRLNAWTPYSGIGELGNYGGVFLAVVALGYGLLIARLDGRVATYRATGRAIFAMALYGLCALVVVDLLQYNLRTSSRILLYALLFDVVVRSFGRFSSKRDRGQRARPLRSTT